MEGESGFSRSSRGPLRDEEGGRELIRLWSCTSVRCSDHYQCILRRGTLSHGVTIIGSISNPKL